LHLDSADVDAIIHHPRITRTALIAPERRITRVNRWTVVRRQMGERRTAVVLQRA
jgi:hypothetical protein